MNDSCQSAVIMKLSCHIKEAWQDFSSSSLSPTCNFDSLHWRQNLNRLLVSRYLGKKTLVYFCLRTNWGHVFENSSCVIFIDRCWEAAVFKSHEIRWVQPLRLRVSLCVDFKTTDKLLFGKTNPSVLTCNPDWVELRLFVISQNLYLILFRCHKNSKVRNNRRGITFISYSFSCISKMYRFLVCFPLQYFLLNFAKP